MQMKVRGSAAQMVEIPDGAAADLLKRDVLRYLAEIAQLERNVPPFPTQCYGDGAEPSNVMLVTEFPYGRVAFISEYQREFVAACMEKLATLPAPVFLNSVDARVFEDEVVASRVLSGTQSRWASLAYAGAAPPGIPAAGVRLLKPEDREAFLAYPHEVAPNRPAFQAFDEFVPSPDGAIFAYEEKGTLQGYLSCGREYENVWDVEFIHVRPESRGKGLGTRLAAAYASACLSHGDVPYYSGPRNEASRRAAEKAGFTVCRELVRTQLDFKAA